MVQCKQHPPLHQAERRKEMRERERERESGLTIIPNWITINILTRGAIIFHRFCFRLISNSNLLQGGRCVRQRREEWGGREGNKRIIPGEHFVSGINIWSSSQSNRQYISFSTKMRGEEEGREREGALWTYHNF